MKRKFLKYISVKLILLLALGCMESQKPEISDSGSEVSEDILIQEKEVVLEGLIVLNGKALRIEADTLIVKDAVIQSFEWGTKSQSDGRAPSPISIKVRNAKGKLKFILNGENGGDAKIPNPWNENDRAGVGLATSSHGTQDCNTYSSQSGHRSYFTDEGQVKRCYCNKFGASASGQKGKKGRTGGNGFRGGDTGRLNIHITETNELDLEVQKVPGRGGKGAPGGLGSLGGMGARGSNSLCGDNNAGSEGARGERGSSGVRGSRGSHTSATLNSQGGTFNL